jgi:hypothetical protein
MSRNGRVFFLAAFSLVQACAGRDVTAPKSAEKNTLVMAADGPGYLTVLPGETLTDFARVKLTLQGNGAPVEGVQVTFVASDETKTVTTGADGIAHFGPWKPGSENGTYSVVASAGRLAPVSFTTRVRSDIVARYDLQSIGGKTLPLLYVGGGTTWQVTGGQYILYANGQYDFYYDFNPPETRPPGGVYVRSANGVIDFYLTAPYSSFYYERNGHFARGEVSGNLMRATYDDPVDFEDEVYVAK